MKLRNASSSIGHQREFVHLIRRALVTSPVADVAAVLDLLDRDDIGASPPQIDSLRSERPRSCAEDELDRLASRYTVSTLVVLATLRDAGYLTQEEYKPRYEAERKRVTKLMDSQENHGEGGNYYHTQLRRLGLPFTRAVISAALEGRTTYRDAYRLLGTVKHSTFEGLAESSVAGTTSLLSGRRDTAISSTQSSAHPASCTLIATWTRLVRPSLSKIWVTTPLTVARLR